MDEPPGERGAQDGAGGRRGRLPTTSTEDQAAAARLLPGQRGPPRPPRPGTPSRSRARASAQPRPEASPPRSPRRQGRAAPARAIHWKGHSGLPRRRARSRPQGGRVPSRGPGGGRRPPARADRVPRGALPRSPSAPRQGRSREASVAGATGAGRRSARRQQAGPVGLRGPVRPRSRSRAPRRPLRHGSHAAAGRPAPEPRVPGGGTGGRRKVGAKGAPGDEGRDGAADTGGLVGHARCASRRGGRQRRAHLSRAPPLPGPRRLRPHAAILQTLGSRTPRAAAWAARGPTGDVVQTAASDGAGGGAEPPRTTMPTMHRGGSPQPASLGKGGPRSGRVRRRPRQSAVRPPP